MQKKIGGFFLIYSCLTSVCYGQFEKGSFFVGGNFSASNQTINSSNDNNSISIVPSMGTFLTPRTALGSSVGYSRNTLLFSNSYSVAFFVKRFYTVAPNFYFTTKLESRYQRSWSDDFAPVGLAMRPTYVLDLQLTPSVIFFPAHNWGVELSTGGVYYSRLLVLPNISSTNSVGFGLSTKSLEVGIFYYFRKKNKENSNTNP